MMKKYVYFIVLLILTGGVKNAEADQTSYNGYKIAFCNVCTTDNLFKLYAETLDAGTYLVVNAEASQAKAIKVIDGVSRDGSETPVKRVSFVPPPADLPQIISEMEQLNQAFDELFNQNFGVSSFSTFSQGNEFDKSSSFNYAQSSDFTGNGCGSPTHGSYWLIRAVEYPFKDACNSHDMCYENGIKGKKECDDQFFIDMMDIIDSRNHAVMFAADGLLNALIMGRIAKEIETIKANKAYDIVSNHPASIVAYCSNKDGSYSECSTTSQPGGGGTHIGDAGTIIDAGDATYSQQCELWRFPDGNNGYYYLERNCSFTRIN